MSATQIPSRQQQIEEVHANIFAERIAKRKAAAAQVHTNGNGSSPRSLNLSDAELLKRACAAKNGDRFRALYDRGDWKGQRYPSQSEADLVLFASLFFWTAGDAARADSLFRSSHLMRDKWNRGDYRESTIAKAIQDCEVYSGHKHVVRDTAASEPGENDSGAAQGDILIADKFLAQHRENVRYCPTRGWLIWDGRRWAWDERERITALAEKTVRQIYRDAAATKDDDAREALLKLGGTYSKSERVRHMLEFARAHVAVVQDELDRDGFLLNCRNGTVDLRTGQLKPHDRKDLITKVIDIDYLGDAAKAPRFEKFLVEIFQGKTDLIDYIKQWFSERQQQEA